MKQYQYQIIRYVHDQFTGEFVNLGIVVYSPENLFLDTIVSNKYARIKAMFPSANGNFIISILKKFESAINSFSKQLAEQRNQVESLAHITNAILPNDDSAILLTDVKYALDINMEIALKDLYAQLVEKYMHNESTVKTLSDNDVWNKEYKSYFDKYKITDRLSNHIVQTKNDNFSFKKSWKNEIWHCYEPISFDLINEESVKDKVYRWAGKLREIEKTNERIHITFLTKLSANHKKLNSLIKESFHQESKNVDVDLVLESDAEKIALKISKEMYAHDQHNN